MGTWFPNNGGVTVLPHMLRQTSGPRRSIRPRDLTSPLLRRRRSLSFPSPVPASCSFLRLLAKIHCCAAGGMFCHPKSNLKVSHTVNYVSQCIPAAVSGDVLPFKP